MGFNACDVVYDTSEEASTWRQAKAPTRPVHGGRRCEWSAEANLDLPRRIKVPPTAY
eukprot:COSAG06_NODE_69535_length_197_cov_26.897959_1_plen_56_part_10